MTQANAGLFDPNMEFNLKCTVRKGDIRNNPRGRAVGKFRVKISEGLEVLRAKALSFLHRTLPTSQLISEDVYFKKSKGAPQSQYIILTNNNFEDLMRQRWNLISKRDIDNWSDKGKSVLDGFYFEAFLYVHKRSHQNPPAGLRRATALRIQEAAQQIQEYQNNHEIEFGDITRHHLTVHHARQPEGTEFTVPNDNTTRQAQWLDERRRHMQESTRNDDRNTKRIRIQINGTWVDVLVDIISLRQALGLPQHDMFDQGIFHEYQHNETAGEDMPDIDHETESQEQQDDG